MPAQQTPERKPTAYATYRGDQRHIVGEVKGPTTYGALFTAVTAEFDGTSTRVGFAPTVEGGINDDHRHHRPRHG